jgi:hypothetical protein
MLRIVRSKETNQFAVVTGSKKKIGDDVNNIRREACRHFRNKRRNVMSEKRN